MSSQGPIGLRALVTNLVRTGFNTDKEKSQNENTIDVGYSLTICLQSLVSLFQIHYRIVFPTGTQERPFVVYFIVSPFCFSHKANTLQYFECLSELLNTLVFAVPKTTNIIL